MKNFINVILDLTDERNSGAEEPAEDAKIADKVAKHLGKPVQPARKHIINLAINEPFFPFVIALDTDRFRASVKIAKSHYSVEIKHRKGERAFCEDALFCVSFKTKDGMMFTKDRVAGVSKELGFPVYRQGFVDDETVAEHLLSDSVRAVLAKIDIKPLTRLFLSPIQLQASSKLKDPAACAEQVRVFMELMEALARARKPEKPKRTDKR